MNRLVAIAYDWAVRCFGIDHVMDRKVRALRLVEEAIELAQAFGVDQQKITDCTALVYSKPPGTPQQEMGGVMLTAAVLCAVMGTYPDEELGIELQRVLAKSPQHFADRNMAKIDAGLA